MNSSRVLPALLLCLTASPVLALSQLYVFIGTGNDDLRAGSSLKLLVQFAGGRSESYDLSRGRRFADNTNTSVVLPISPPSTTHITRLALAWQPDRRDFMGDDEWQMNQISVHDGAGPGDPVIFDLQASATGSHKFRGVEELVLTTVSATHVQCQSDGQCSDGLFCNGTELCQPGTSGADARGCATGIPPCAGSACDERAQACSTACVDADGDGALAAHCGGNDCNDNDAGVYPGNVERWDAANRDEDCDPDTTGFSAGMAEQVQFCDGEKVQIMASSSRFIAADCPAGTKCIPQPNGTGVCGTPPPGYQAPQRFAPPGRQQVQSPATLVPRKTSLLKPGARQTSTIAPQ
ncbi:MAG: putative metal-binding motif-containing protein [Pseudomonadales bacterium]|nr:putative metal-binding motif-containing protein [Pseudomonadales bacterium]